MIDDPELMEQQIFDKLMQVVWLIRDELCISDKDWILVMQMMRLQSASSVFYFCKENGILDKFDISNELCEFDLDMKEDIRVVLNGL